MNLQQISPSRISTKGCVKNLSATNAVSNPISNVLMPKVSEKVDSNKLTNAYRAYNNIKLASTVSFGNSLSDILDKLRGSLVTCAGPESESDGEVVGELTKVTELVGEASNELKKSDDAIKTSDKTFKYKKGIKEVRETRIQVKKLNEPDEKEKLLFELTKRWPRPNGTEPDRSEPPEQSIKIAIEPQRYSYGEMRYVGTKELAYILKSKGKEENNIVVVEDGENVILTDTGKLSKNNKKLPCLEVFASKKDSKTRRPNEYVEFKVPEVFEVKQKSGGSEGGGTELIIGLEKGRFVPEIIASIEKFQEKIESGEIVLDKYVPAKGVENIQIAMLAGGFGSRAEYANASSSRIMHNEKDGSNLTKGCFRTATGLTPMETSFISLHNAGYLDCSKGNFGIGKNIKFYLNDSGKNGGNGSFTVDLFNTMDMPERKSLLILPNDAMSRIPKALVRLNEKINSGEAAMVMIAKQVTSANAEGNLGIMKIDDDGTGIGLIKAFAEKPVPVPDNFKDERGNCFANTFQFAVSKEAFEVLIGLEKYIAVFDEKKKEARDWSKTYTPILMAITQNSNIQEMREEIIQKTGIIIPAEDLQKAKDKLGNQKIYAIKTDEPWADCGTLNALYHTTCEIARGEFELEPFERKNVLDSFNAKTGLIYIAKDQKDLSKERKKFEEKWDAQGQIMVVPKAEAVDAKEVMERNKDAITTYRSKHPVQQN